LDTSRISIGKVSERIGIEYVTDADTWKESKYIVAFKA
jgi:hypothetical protein